MLSGGRAITGWKVGPEGRWQTTLDEVKQGGWNFAQLFVNDQRRFRPRLPAHGYYHVDRELPPSPEAGGRGFDRLGYSGDELRPDWANLGDVEVMAFQQWSASRMRIAKVDPHEHTVRFTGQHAVYRRLCGARQGQPLPGGERQGSPGRAGTVVPGSAQRRR